MSIEKSVGISAQGPIRYCAECGAKVPKAPKAQKVCPACGESQA